MRVQFFLLDYILDYILNLSLNFPYIISYVSYNYDLCFLIIVLERFHS